ncbi:MAG: YjbQ family protein [Candidatus Omnitrophica bacterium]|nr:YjbQ family protein [Candidatus Omnitrophota bacterium]
MKVIKVNTHQREEFIDITQEVESAVRESKIKEGVCFVFSPHTTAGITINENADPSVKKDILNHLKKLVPFSGDYSHSEGNADAHIKASLLGNSVTVLVEGGNLVLGTWQGIYFCEFDGPRRRKLYVYFLPTFR